MHIAAAVIPGTHGRLSDLEQASVIVARIVEMPRPGALVLDADITRVAAHTSEARLIGRASTQHSAPFVLRAEATTTESAATEATTTQATAILPADLRVGDLVAIPCRGAVCRRQLRSTSAS